MAYTRKINQIAEVGALFKLGNNLKLLLILKNLIYYENFSNYSLL